MIDLTEYYFLFQFLMVRLKVSMSIQKNNTSSFQFLMVRLKVHLRFCFIVLRSVSIPYGTIKSFTAGIDFLKYYLVSIPYGTIKRRYYAFKTSNDYILFQFLMVRLKVRRSYSLRSIKRVSIPYGTIKSLTTYDTVRTLDTFQFLMVRLKVGLSPTTSVNTLVSIPYGTIKSLNLQKNKSLILLPLRYYKDRKNKRIKCRCPIIMKCRFIDTILNV